MIKHGSTKKVRLITILAASVITLAGLANIGCEGKSSNPLVEVSPLQAITYRAIDERAIPNGGYVRVVVIDPKNRNDSDLRALGDLLRKDTASDRNAFVFIYDDQRAANQRKAAMDDRLSKKDLSHHDNHWVGSYTRNANTGLHRLAYGLSGFNGSQTLVNY